MSLIHDAFLDAEKDVYFFTFGTTILWICLFFPYIFNISHSSNIGSNNYIFASFSNNIFPIVLHLQFWNKNWIIFFQIFPCQTSWTYQFCTNLTSLWIVMFVALWVWVLHIVRSSFLHEQIQYKKLCPPPYNVFHFNLAENNKNCCG